MDNSVLQKTNGRFIAGAAIQAIGFGLLFAPYGLLIGILVSVVGALTMLSGRAAIRTKLMFLLAPALIYGVIQFVSAELARGESSVVLIPAGYRGEVRIIYSQRHGQPVKYDGKTRVYEIPPCGILLTQFAPDTGTLSDRKYYLTEGPARTRLEETDAELTDSLAARGRTSTPAGIFNGGTLCSITYGQSNKTVIYESFFVGSEAAFRQTFTHPETHLDSLQEILMRDS